MRRAECAGANAYFDDDDEEDDDEQPSFFALNYFVLLTSGGAILTWVMCSQCVKIFCPLLLVECVL